MESWFRIPKLPHRDGLEGGGCPRFPSLPKAICIVCSFLAYGGRGGPVVVCRTREAQAAWFAPHPGLALLGAWFSRSLIVYMRFAISKRALPPPMTSACCTIAATLVLPQLGVPRAVLLLGTPVTEPRGAAGKHPL